MKLKMTLDVVKTLDKVFKNRTLTEQSSDCPVKVLSHEQHQEILIFDLSISSKILTSDSFASIDYFKPGIKHLAQTGNTVNRLNDFYDHSILFKEDSEHHQVKKAFHYLLDNLCVELQENKPLISNYIRKRKQQISSPLIFSTTLVRISTGLMISRLTDIPLKRVLHSLSLRHNVFCSHFHPTRHLAINDAFSYLYGNSSSEWLNSPEKDKHLLAQSLIVMGVDPMIGSICANIVEGNTENFADGASRHCATSFVSRVCVKPYILGEISFNPGDVCYISLVPRQVDETTDCPSSSRNPSSLAFGIGMHTCIGKRLSLVVLEIAEEIIRDQFSNGFEKTSVICPDGAFLAFQDSK